MDVHPDVVEGDELKEMLLRIRKAGGFNLSPNSRLSSKTALQILSYQNAHAYSLALLWSA